MKALHPLTFAIALLLGTSSFDADAARRNSSKTEETVTYPDATRESPESKISSRIMRDIEKLQDAYNEGGREAETMEIADRIIANERANPYEKGLAALLAGGAAANTDDVAAATKYLQMAIDGGALPNENHYNAMFTLASVQFNNEQWAQAQQTLARLVTETQTKDPEVHKLLGAAFYNAEQYAEAIPHFKRSLELDTDGTDDQTMQMLLGAYAETDNNGEALTLAEELHRKNPQDKRALLNLVALYGESDQQEKATALLDTARQAGMMTTADDYKRLYATYFTIEREAEAAAVIEEGLAKNLLPADGETYTNLAQAHYFSDNIDGAIAAAQKGAPLAKDGQLALFLSQVLNQEDRNAESIAAAKQALAKGIKSPGEAWMVIARAEYYSDNPEGAKAAFREAAKDPGTASQANAELSKLSR